VEVGRATLDQALLALTRERQPRVRTQAAQALVALAHEEALRDELAGALPRLLEDSQEEVRRAAVMVAAQVLPPAELRELLVRTLSDTSELVRVECAGQLADLHQPPLRGVLATALEDDSFAVRFEAARGMAALRHSAGLDVLTEALDDPHLRFRAVGALAELGDVRAIPALQRLFHRWLLPGFERTQAAGALAALGWPDGAQYLIQRTRSRWGADRALAVELCGEVRAQGALARLTEIARDPKDACRGAAARGLGRLGDPAAVETLLGVFEDAASPHELKLDAAEGVCLMGGVEPLARLEAAVSRVRDERLRAELTQLFEEYRDA
jgi:HEAT repeat protein